MYVDQFGEFVRGNLGLRGWGQLKKKRQGPTLSSLIKAGDHPMKS